MDIIWKYGPHFFFNLQGWLTLDIDVDVPYSYTQSVAGDTPVHTAMFCLDTVDNHRTRLKPKFSIHDKPLVYCWQLSLAGNFITRRRDALRWHVLWICTISCRVVYWLRRMYFSHHNFLESDGQQRVALPLPLYGRCGSPAGVTPQLHLLASLHRHVIARHLRVNCRQY